MGRRRPAGAGLSRSTGAGPDPGSGPVPLDIVIPCLNAAASLPSLIRDLTDPGEAAAVTPRVLVVDGGSVDGSAALAAAAGATVLSAPRGRGAQLAAGAASATAPWLLFLHADTRLAAGWRAAVACFMAEPGNARRAAYFRLRFDSAAPAARSVERLAAWRARALGLPYGDQGLLIARVFHEELGGYRTVPLMEDVDLVRRIGRRRLVALPLDAVTSAERYERDGWRVRPARNLLCLALYFAGVPPRLIRRVYG